MFPIIVPMPQSSPPHCPNCGRLEKIIRTCAHCKYVYIDNDASWPLGIFGTMLFITGIVAVLICGVVVITSVFDWIDGRTLTAALARNFGELFHMFTRVF